MRVVRCKRSCTHNSHQGQGKNAWPGPCKKKGASFSALFRKYPPGGKNSPGCVYNVISFNLHVHDFHFTRHEGLFRGSNGSRLRAELQEVCRRLPGKHFLRNRATHGTPVWLVGKRTTKSKITILKKATPCKASHGQASTRLHIRHKCYVQL